MKGSGVLKHFMYFGPEKDADDVAMKVFDGNDDRYYVDLYGKTDKIRSYIRVSEIAAIDIYEKR
jgi:hypothetical protein